MTTTPSMIFPYRILPVLLIIGAMIAGCSSPPKHSTAGSPPYRGGGYYKDDGPGRNIPADVANIPDAVPRIEPHNRANFRPYTVMGQRFVPVGANTALQQRGVASWYGRKFHGKKTANGETYDMYAMTAAHPTLPLPSYARVTHQQSGRSVIVRVNDRGPFLRGRVIDLSYAAAAKLGILGKGSDVVVVEAITHADIRNGLNMAASKSPPVVASAAAPAPQAQPVATQAPVPAAAPTPAAAVHQVAVTSEAPVAEPAPTPDALAVLDSQVLGALHGDASTAPTVTEEPSKGIYLQFGAFGSYITADQLASRLNRKIAQVELREVHIDSGNDLHRVRLGPYPSRTAAVNAAVRIQEATGMQPVLAQR